MCCLLLTSERLSIHVIVCSLVLTPVCRPGPSHRLLLSVVYIPVGAPRALSNKESVFPDLASEISLTRLINRQSCCSSSIFEPSVWREEASEKRLGNLFFFSSSFSRPVISAIVTEGLSVQFEQRPIKKPYSPYCVCVCELKGVVGHQAGLLGCTHS